VPQLKALFVGLCLLFVVTQAAAAAKGEHATHGTKPSKSAETKGASVSLEKRLEQKLGSARKYRSVVRFFRNHRGLLSSTDHRVLARTALRRANRRLARVTRTITELRQALARREAQRLAKAPPKVAICHVFGRRYCRQALAVSWCESRYRTTAQNGQYLGLFQMGSYERRLFGHGSTPRDQAVAAHRYFVLSGRDWSPWSCKPWYAT
jgi:hypothetical protein